MSPWMRPRTTASQEVRHDASLGRGAADATLGCRMQQRSLGARLRVSRLGLGLMTWGGETDEHEARDQLAAFVDAGGTLLDTPTPTPAAPRRSCSAAARHVVPREDVVLATKAGVGVRRGARVMDTSRGYLLRCLDSVAARGSASTRSTCGRCTCGPTRRRSRRRCRRSTPRWSTGRAAYVGVSNWERLADRPGAPPGSGPCRAGRRWSRPRWSTRCSTAASSTRWCRPRGSSASGSCPGRRWAAACSPASTAPARRPTRAAPREMSQWVDPYRDESSS